MAPKFLRMGTRSVRCFRNFCRRHIKQENVVFFFLAGPLLGFPIPVCAWNAVALGIYGEVCALQLFRSARALSLAGAFDAGRRVATCTVARIFVSFTFFAVSCNHPASIYMYVCTRSFAVAAAISASFAYVCVFVLRSKPLSTRCCGGFCL